MISSTAHALVDQPHQHDAGMTKIVILVAQLLRPLRPVEEVVAKAPGEHRQGQHLVVGDFRPPPTAPQ
jgi:hypothetical protein